MYPEAPTCSIRSLSFISICSFLFSDHSQAGSRVGVWSPEFVPLPRRSIVLVIVIVLLSHPIEQEHEHDYDGVA